MAGLVSDAEIIEELVAMVSDLSLIVSYKWLSRKFSISSNAAKRLLDKFVDKYGDGVEVVYVISGWTHAQPRTYSIQLVTLPQLEEAKALLKKEPSVHVYSIQASLPRDPAQLWKPDHIQAQELFNQPPQVSNCLRDNRFSSVSCSLIKRDVKGKVSSVAPPPARETSSKATTKSSDVGTSTGAGRLKQAADSIGAGSSFTAKETKGEVNGREVAKPAKGEASRGVKKSKQGSGGSISNLWGRSSKSSKRSPPDIGALEHVLGNADASIAAVEEHENGASSDDDVTHFRRLRRGGRKRMVVLDDDVLSEQNEEQGAPPDSLPAEDEEEPVISLMSPVKKADDIKDKETNSKSSTEKTVDIGKRRKVLKTHIDGRGREVSEVVWETEESKPSSIETSKLQEAQQKPPEAKATKTAEVKAANKQPVPKAPTAKASSRSGGKARKPDPQQGSITSFFKKK